ncbi:MAG: protein-export chaperone SecB [Pseudomonadota bacterium]
MAKATKAKEEPKTANNGGGAQQPVQPMLNVLAQYVKDFSFENPHAPNSLRSREKSPEIAINVNVNTNAMDDNNFEVELQLEAKAMAGEEMVFNTELNYAGIFRLQGIPAEAMQAALLIECPRILFPFARQIISESTRNGGFPPLMIDPIDFARLYQSRAAEAAQA